MSGAVKSIRVDQETANEVEFPVLESENDFGGPGGRPSHRLAGLFERGLAGKCYTPLGTFRAATSAWSAAWLGMKR